MSRAEEAAAASSLSLNLLDMPVELFEEILSYMSYDEIAQLRLVSDWQDAICSMLIDRILSLSRSRGCSIVAARIC